MLIPPRSIRSSALTYIPLTYTRGNSSKELPRLRDILEDNGEGLTARRDYKCFGRIANTGRRSWTNLLKISHHIPKRFANNLAEPSRSGWVDGRPLMTPNLSQRFGEAVRKPKIHPSHWSSGLPSQYSKYHLYSCTPASTRILLQSSSFPVALPRSPFLPHVQNSSSSAAPGYNDAIS